MGGVSLPAQTHPAATQALLAKLGPQVVKTDEASCFAASFDNMRLSFMPEAVIRPATEDDIGVTLKLANEHRVPVTVRGRGTGTTGACAPIKGGWVIHLDHWDQIEIDPVSSMATVQPGAITAHINDRAAPHGLFFPPDPSSVKHCSIGGNIATNAGGLRAAKYGVVRDHVYALEGFLPTGEKVRWAAPLRKFVPQPARPLDRLRRHARRDHEGDDQALGPSGRPPHLSPGLQDRRSGARSRHRPPLAPREPVGPRVPRHPDGRGHGETPWPARLHRCRTRRFRRDARRPAR
ncbi:MAG: FAD-binding protein [Verrucomicrobia bacterium]|nr:FAD-binding protein [Verrucomicrobiota bacterium]